MIKNHIKSTIGKIRLLRETKAKNFNNTIFSNAEKKKSPYAFVSYFAFVCIIIFTVVYFYDEFYIDTTRYDKKIYSYSEKNISPKYEDDKEKYYKKNYRDNKNDDNGNYKNNINKRREIPENETRQERIERIKKEVKEMNERLDREYRTDK